jgi:hypothetical protein
MSVNYPFSEVDIASVSAPSLPIIAGVPTLAPSGP